MKKENETYAQYKIRIYRESNKVRCKKCTCYNCANRDTVDCNSCAWCGDTHTGVRECCPEKSSNKG
jgi:hypothetical protein